MPRKANRTRDTAIRPAPQQQPRRSKRRSSGETPRPQAQYAGADSASQAKMGPLQWLSFIAIALIGIT
jgi:hypothetical protein